MPYRTSIPRISELALLQDFHPLNLARLKGLPSSDSVTLPSCRDFHPQNLWTCPPPGLPPPESCPPQGTSVSRIRGLALLRGLPSSDSVTLPSCRDFHPQNLWPCRPPRISTPESEPCPPAGTSIPRLADLAVLHGLPSPASRPCPPAVTSIPRISDFAVRPLKIYNVAFGLYRVGNCAVVVTCLHSCHQEKIYQDSASFDHAVAVL